MPFQGFAFDDSVTQTEPGRVRVPEAYYLLECAGAEPTAEDYDKNTSIIFNFTIREGAAGIGRSIPQYCVLSVGQKNGRGTQFGLGRALGALGQAQVAKALNGQNIDSYEKFKALTAGISQRVKGKLVVALIADQPGLNGGRPFSGIEELLPADEWASMKGLAAPSSAPAAAAAVNGASAAAAPAAPVGTLPAELAALFNT